MHNSFIQFRPNACKNKKEVGGWVELTLSPLQTDFGQSKTMNGRVHEVT